MATLRAAMVTGGQKPPQKFGYQYIFFGQLLSQKCVSQKIYVGSPPLINITTTNHHQYEITYGMYHVSRLLYFLFQ